MHFNHDFGLSWDWQGERITITHRNATERVVVKKAGGPVLLSGTWLGSQIHTREGDVIDMDYARRGFIEDICSLLETLSEFHNNHEGMDAAEEEV